MDYARSAFVNWRAAVSVHHQANRREAIVLVVVRLAAGGDDAVVGRGEMPAPLLAQAVVTENVEGHDDEW